MPRWIFEINNTVLECLNLNILLVVFADGSCIVSMIFIVSDSRGGESNYCLRTLPERYKGIREAVPFSFCASGVLCSPWSHTHICVPTQLLCPFICNIAVTCFPSSGNI